MIIGIDIRVLGTGRKSGIEEYTEQLLARLLPCDRSIQYKLFYSSYTRQLKGYSWLALPNVSVYQFRIPNRLLFNSASFLGLPKIDRMLGGVDLLFSPHFFLAPVSSGVKRVITFHDLSYERFPEFFSVRQRFWHRLQMRPKKQAGLADRIVAVSDSTKNDLLELYGIPADKVVRIYSGIAPEFSRPSSEAIARFKSEHGLPERYILALGTLEPRKNIIGLIKAFEVLKQSDGFSDLHLVIAGARGWLYGDVVRAIRCSVYAGYIRSVEIESDLHRPMYYSGAAVFAYPSFFEGFGFPPLEAAACGTPVVASHQASLPEVLGNAAVLVDPSNISELANSLASVLRDDNFAEELSRRGQKQASRFSWDTSAKAMLEVFRKVLRGQ